MFCRCLTSSPINIWSLSYIMMMISMNYLVCINPVLAGNAISGISLFLCACFTFFSLRHKNNYLLSKEMKPCISAWNNVPLYLFFWLILKHELCTFLQLIIWDNILYVVKMGNLKCQLYWIDRIGEIIMLIKLKKE